MVLVFLRTFLCSNNSSGDELLFKGLGSHEARAQNNHWYLFWGALFNSSFGDEVYKVQASWRKTMV